MADKDITELNAAVEAVTTKDVENKMILLRGQYVLLVRDVAVLYGVKTKEINQAVRNNPKNLLLVT